LVERKGNPSNNGKKNGKKANSTSFKPNNNKATGRPKGSLNKATVFLQYITHEDLINAFDIINKIVTGEWEPKKGIKVQGDKLQSAVDASTAFNAAKYIIDRCMRKTNPWALTIPTSPKQITNAQELQQEVNALRNARIEGIISPEELALELSNLDSISAKIYAELEHNTKMLAEKVSNSDK